MKMKSNPIIIKKSPSPLSGARGPRVAIPGVYPSTSQFGEQVVKFRVPSLDAFIGGGVPVGSVCIIFDEFPSKFGDMVLKSFIADGASHNHRIFIASDKVLPVDLANDLPSLRKSSSENDSSIGGDGDPDTSLKIAWRYGQSQANSKGFKGGAASDANLQAFDFSKKSSVSDLGGKNLILSKSCCDTDLSSTSCTRGDKVISEIVDAIEGLSYEASGAVNNVARICVSHCEDIVLSPHFLLRLKAIVRHSNSCAVLTISDAAFCGETIESAAKQSLFSKAEHLSDIVISIQSLVDQKRRDDLGGIDGICNIKKVASNNSLKIFEPPKDVGISFKKKKLLFHELHLPPEGETTTQRETSSSKEKSAGLHSQNLSTTACATSPRGNKLDF